MDPAIFRAEITSDQFHAACVQRAVVQVVPAAMAGRLRVPKQPGARRWQLGEGAIPESRLDDPPHHVVVAQATRHPRAAAAGEDHLASRVVKLFRELASGLAAAHDHHRAVRKLRFIREFFGQQLVHAGWQLL